MFFCLLCVVRYFLFIIFVFYNILSLSKVISLPQFTVTIPKGFTEISFFLPRISRLNFFSFSVISSNGTDMIQPGMLFMSDTNDVHRIVKYSSEAAVCAHNITVKAKVIESLLDFFPANTRKTFIKNKCPFYTLSADMLTKIEHSVYHYNSLDASKYEFGNTVLLSLVFQLLTRRFDEISFFVIRFSPAI